LAEKAFKNTLAPAFDGKAIDVATAMGELRYAMIREGGLPGEVHAAVTAELDRR